MTRWLSILLLSIFAFVRAFRAMFDVASVEPSLTTMSSLCGEFVSRYAIVCRSESPMRCASLYAGMTTEKGGNIQ